MPQRRLRPGVLVLVPVLGQEQEQVQVQQRRCHLQW
jgi:hypothetical protein